MRIRRATSILLTTVTALSAHSQAPSPAMHWENRQLLDSATPAQYEAERQQAMRVCDREARMSVPMISPQACQRAMTAGNPQLLNMCLATGVDCTDAYSTPSPMLWDQCNAYANQVAERRQYQAQRTGMACMMQNGWRLIPVQ